MWAAGKWVLWGRRGFHTVTMVPLRCLLTTPMYNLQYQIHNWPTEALETLVVVPLFPSGPDCYTVSIISKRERKVEECKCRRLRERLREGERGREKKWERVREIEWDTIRHTVVNESCRHCVCEVWKCWAEVRPTGLIVEKCALLRPAREPHRNHN